MGQVAQWLRRAAVFVALLVIPFAWKGYGPQSRPYTITADPAPQVLMVTPGDALPLITLLDSAREELDVWMYTLTNPELVDALVRAAERGVRVRFIWEDRPFGAESPPEVIKRLQDAGVIVIADGDPDSFVHAKTVVIDRSRIIVGTANWTKAAFSTNREVFVTLDDATTAEALAELFDHDAMGDVRGSVQAPLVVSPQQSRVVFEGLIAGAARDIVIAVEVFEDPSIIERLAVARGRGVTVQVLLADPKRIAPNGATAERLRQSGVEVNFATRPFLHAKYFVIDGATSFVGSQNLTAQSLDVNREIGVVTRSPHVAVELLNIFHRDVVSK
ncbi:MAG: phospholipase D-like domain-containing protein [bacterium]|nr:phospholipase D-like domain-containing protein [bacterium]